jgi:host factor-I protein
MAKQQLLQDAMLNQLRKEKCYVTVHLTNGVPLKGYVRGFDSFVVVLDCDGKQMMVYKHAISTVTPGREINLMAIMQENAEQST